MDRWNRYDFFLDKPGLFDRLERMGLDKLENTAYSADYVLWKMLQKGQLNGFRFRRQQRVLKMNVSFYCEEARLVVDFEHIDHKMRRKEDAENDHVLQKAGIKVLRFPREMVLERPVSVKNAILEELTEISKVR
jgi:very-short-patch-repair endonuclease